MSIAHTGATAAEHLVDKRRQIAPAIVTGRQHAALRGWQEVALESFEVAQRSEGLVIEFARAASTEPELRYLADYLSAGWPRIDPSQRFFLDAEKPGSRTAARKLGRNLAAYARWGFVGTERPVADVDTKRTVGRYDAPTRRRILERLLDARGEVTLAEYLDAVDNAVSRQQGHADLAAHPDLAVTGRGRGARWVRKARRRGGRRR